MTLIVGFEKAAIVMNEINYEFLVKQNSKNHVIRFLEKR